MTTGGARHPRIYTHTAAAREPLERVFAVAAAACELARARARVTVSDKRPHAASGVAHRQPCGTTW